MSYFLRGGGVSKQNFSLTGKSLKNIHGIITLGLHVSKGQNIFVKLENYTWFACQQYDNFQGYI